MRHPPFNSANLTSWECAGIIPYAGHHSFLETLEGCWLVIPLKVQKLAERRATPQAFSYYLVLLHMRRLIVLAADRFLTINK